MQKYYTMKDLPESERPYEIVEEKGAAELTDAQLLAVFLRTGSRGEKAVDLAYRLLNEGDEQTDPLIRLFQMPLSDLMEIKGIGRVKAIQLKAVFELSSRIASRNAKSHMRMNNAQSVAAAYMETMRHLTVETPYVLYLNSRLELIGEKKLTEGLLQNSVIDFRKIILEGYQKGAVSMVLLHNHPSGDPRPSQTDIELTNELSKIAAFMEIKLNDHIIIGDNSFFSFREAGYLMQEGAF